MERRERKAQLKALKALAQAQMGRVERMGLWSPLAGLPAHLAEDERVDQLFGGQIDGKQAVVALTDRRLLAVYGMVGRVYSVTYAAINQLSTGLTKVEIEGSGVKLELKAVARRDQLVQALDERRRAAASSSSAQPSTPADDPAALLAKLGQLRDAGVLTDEEFAAKKTELLERM